MGVWKHLLSASCPDIFSDVRRLGLNLLTVVAVVIKFILKEHPGETHINPWLIHVNVWQKPLQHCKVISLQLRKIIWKKNNKRTSISFFSLLTPTYTLCTHPIYTPGTPNICTRNTQHRHQEYTTPAYIRNTLASAVFPTSVDLLQGEEP